MKKISIALTLMLAAITVGLWVGCSTAPTGNINTNIAPQTFLVNVPPGNDTINAVSLVYWYGRDDDGVVAYYEIFFSGDSVNSSTITEWDSVFASSDTMKLTVDDVPDSLIVLDTVIDTIIGVDTTYKIHEIWNFRGYFYVRAVDDEGLKDPTPAIRSWDVYSEKPVIEIAAPDGSSGIVKYFIRSRPSFWEKNDTAVMFYLNQTTPIWRGLHIWWSRKDTLNEEWNIPIGYRLKVDGGNWTAWTDENPLTSNDSFIILNDSSIGFALTEGMHVAYLQGRNASHVESEVDSVIFRTINPSLGQKEIVVLFATGQSWSMVSWYQGFFSVVRPQSTVRYINRSQGVLEKDSLKNAGLVIYVRDDQFTTAASFAKDTIALGDYLNVGGKLWTFGLSLIVSQADTTGLGGVIIRDYLGIEYFNCSGTIASMNGVYPTDAATALNIPSDTLMADSTHTFPVNNVPMKYGENFPSSDPLVTVAYKWIGAMPYDETPVGIFYENPALGIKSASFGFSGRSMQWDAATYEPLASLYDAVLDWFGM